MFLRGETEVERLKELDAIRKEVEGNIFTHFKGTSYNLSKVTTFQSANFPELDGRLLVAVYYDINGNFYTRPLGEFFDILFDSDEFKERFTKHEDFSW